MVDQFQFHKVRLKRHHGGNEVRFLVISIPQGPIEALVPEQALGGFALFQFHKVRLKPA